MQCGRYELRNGNEILIVLCENVIHTYSGNNNNLLTDRNIRLN